MFDLFAPIHTPRATQSIAADQLLINELLGFMKIDAPKEAHLLVNNLESKFGMNVLSQIECALTQSPHFDSTFKNLVHTQDYKKRNLWRELFIRLRLSSILQYTLLALHQSSAEDKAKPGHQEFLAVITQLDKMQKQGTPSNELAPYCHAIFDLMNSGSHTELKKNEKICAALAKAAQNSVSLSWRALGIAIGILGAALLLIGGILSYTGPGIILLSIGAGLVVLGGGILAGKYYVNRETDLSRALGQLAAASIESTTLKPKLVEQKVSTTQTISIQKPKSLPLLSDHAYQSTHFQILDSQFTPLEHEVINVGSWNLLNKCYSKQSNMDRQIADADRIKKHLEHTERKLANAHPSDQKYPQLFKAFTDAKKRHQDAQEKLNQYTAFSNNPYDIDESLDDYKRRKEAQINQLIKNIRTTHGDDIVCLQEVDFLTTKTTTKPSDIYLLQQRLKSKLISELSRHGYSLVTSNGYETTDTTQQKMALLYNSEKYQLNSGKGVLPTIPSTPADKTQFRGLELSFTSRASGTELVITNLHLTYAKDYRDELEVYQNSMKQRGVLNIMAGDTNNIQCEHLNTALGDWHAATNFEGTLDPNTNKITLTTTHQTMSGSHLRKHLQKAYDRFFISAPQNHYVTAKSNNERNEQFTIGADGKIIVSKTNSTHTAISDLGGSYMRGIDMLKSLNRQLATSKQEDKAGILSEMKRVIQLKGIKDNVLRKTVSTETINQLKEDVQTNANSPELR